MPSMETPLLAPSILRTLDRTGDSTITWTRGNEAETRAAREHFEMLRGKGYLAYRKDSAGNRETVHTWDEARSSGEAVMAPQTVGG